MNQHSNNPIAWAKNTRGDSARPTPMLVTALASLLLASPMLSADNAWPDPEYLEEQMEEFAQPTDLGVVYGFSRHEERVATGDLEALHQHTIFLDAFKPFPTIYGAVEISVPGADVYRFLSFDRQSLHPIHRPTNGLARYNLWDEEGYLRSLNTRQTTNQDLELGNQLERLNFLYSSEAIEPDGLDLSLLSPDHDLQGVLLSLTHVRNIEAFCRYPTLTYLQVAMSTVEGSLDTQDCFGAMENLYIFNSGIDALTVADLPNLHTLYLAQLRTEQLVIDGSSLPALRSINLSQVDIADSIGNIDLPEGLTQLLLYGVEATDLNDLVLPEDLEFLDLQYAQLDDYSFITAAPNLTTLNLQLSNFDQWELLAELPNLKHLHASGTRLDDADLEIIADLENLQSLLLGGTNITTLLPLEPLQGLNRLTFSGTGVVAADDVPFIENISYLGITDEIFDRYEDNWPDHMAAMIDTIVFGNQCNGLKSPCDRAPWSDIRH